MKLSNFLFVKAIISLGFGILYAVVPGLVSSIFGLTLDPAGTAMARFVGAGLIGVGLICWLERQTEPKALRNITLSLFVADTIGFVIALLGQLSGLTNALGWLIVLVWLFLAAGLGYFRLLKPGGK